MKKLRMNFSENVYEGLAKQFAMSESEKDIDKILKGHKIFHGEKNWRNYGDLPNNFGTIGNQQSNSTLALVEKIVNSIDAVLISESKKRGINPESNKSPKNMTEAVETFFNIKDGNITNLSSRKQTELAKNINLIATGYKSKPCYIIYDKGEGQNPKDFPDTLLSLHKSNKDKVLFVQGRFNMGGTGALPFCGRKNYQFVLSKKHPEINKEKDNYWGFTLVRRRRPKTSEKSSVYEYFAPNNKIPKFKAKKLEILPSSKTGDYDKIIEYGTLIKLYEYDITERTLATFNLYYSLNRVLFKMPIPVRIIDTRNYSGKTKETTLTGMVSRISNYKDINKIIEKDFPIDTEIRIKGLGKATIKIWLFKDGQEESWLKSSEAIILTINGQAHATFDKRFFNRNNVKKSWIKDSLLVHVDCTNFKKSVKEDLFMGSRDRMRRGRNLGNKLERELEKLIKNDPTLIKWNKIRKEEKMKNALNEQSEETKGLFQELVKNNSEIAALFGSGKSLANPWKMGPNSNNKEFNGKRFPSYFELINPKNKIKNCPENNYCRIIFKTDVENEFLTRANDPGKLRIQPNNLVKGRKLRNGRLTLTIEPLLMNLKEGDEIDLKIALDSFGAAPIFSHNILLKITAKDKSKHEKRGKTKNLTDKLNLPEVQFLGKKNWPETWTEDETVLIKSTDDDLTIIVNKDNVHLQRILKKKNLDKTEMKLEKEKFKIALSIIGFSIYSQLDDDQDKELMTKKMTKPISQVILPLLDGLSGITEKAV